MVFLNVYVVFIYIATWRNKEWSTKLNFSVLYIYIYKFFKKRKKKSITYYDLKVICIVFLF